MNTLRTRHSLALAAGVAATAALVGLAAGCSSTKQEAPTTTPSSTSPTTTESSQSPVTPTENDLSPNGANSFTPTHVQMPSPPTAGAGEHFH